VWVRDDAVRPIHRRQLAEHGGADGIRDEGLLSSAMAHPRNHVAYSHPKPSLSTLAAAYAFGIARNHPFIDGNKRTAFVVCELFLALNGKSLQATQHEKYQTFLSLAAGEVSEEQLSHWIEAHCT
jgi:death-on-curing protein